MKRFERTWLNQHGQEYEVPAEIIRLVVEGKLTDISWKNDTCPCFQVSDGVKLWVDHPEPHERESVKGKRFMVELVDDRHTLDCPIETDSLVELLLYLKDHWDI